MYLLARKLKRFIRANCWEGVDRMLNDKVGLVNFNFADEHWQMKAATPLFLTVELCLEGVFEPDKVEYLLRRGADPNKSSLFEGDHHLPLYLCTVVAEDKSDRALTVAKMLVEHGSSVQGKNLLPNTVQRMINCRHERDYNTTMIEFICRNGCPARQKHDALAKLVSQRVQWAPVIATCLLNEGVYIYSLGLNNPSPHYFSTRYNTLTAEIVQNVDRALKKAKNVINFEKAVHHEEGIDVPAAQLRHYVINFDAVVQRIRKNERNAYLALKHTQSKANVLPTDIFRCIMPYVLSERAKRRIAIWI